MGKINSPTFVLPLLAVTSRHDAAFSWAQSQFSQTFGSLNLVSDKFVFDQTDYYSGTMGIGLMKQFVVPSRLCDPGDLSDWKRLTNSWEDLFVTTSDYGESRPINLDPGYLSEDKLVLATTKNHAHRLYLKDGIYAEVTLRYQSRKWQDCPWTYPDYRQQAYHEFFLECRQFLRDQLRNQP